MPSHADESQQCADARELLKVLRSEQQTRLKGGIYHRTQVEMTYNSNHIEGSRLSREQTRLIFETNTFLPEGNAAKVDDIVETANHFSCVDMVIKDARRRLSEAFIKHLHATLKSGTADSRLEWFRTGQYKSLPNEVGGQATTPPEHVAAEMKQLIVHYNSINRPSIDDILDFHHRFELIHPFQDGNGRVGRLVMFKQCLQSGIVPFIITDELKAFYYRGLSEWPLRPGYLRDTCLSAQDDYRAAMQYFRIGSAK